MNLLFSPASSHHFRYIADKYSLHAVTNGKMVRINRIFFFESSKPNSRFTSYGMKEFWDFPAEIYLHS
jgi:hypothetical protein